MNCVDKALDRSVIGGFSRLGLIVRSRYWTAGDPASDALAGKTVLVTGATSGIGAEIAAGAARLGARVILVGRNRDRAESTREAIVGDCPDAVVDVEICDVSDEEQIRDLAARVVVGAGVDVLVHNAGVIPPERQETAGGNELTLATHVLGPVLLTELLLPHLAEKPDPRVIFMSSGGMYTASLPVGDIQYRVGNNSSPDDSSADDSSGTDYNGTRAYARTKRIQVALAPILAQRWQSSGITVAVMHPGWVKTAGLADSLPRFSRLVGPILRTPAQGADTALWLAATQPPPPSGKFWSDRAIRPEHFLKRTTFTEAQRLSVWEDVRAAAGIDH